MRAEENLPEEAKQLLLESLKNLSDKSPEKRKAATLEIEHLVRNIYESRPELSRIMLNQIRTEVEIPTSRNKKAGLLAFSSICHTIVKRKPEDMHLVLETTCKAMCDDDPKVRFAACESMYNILNTCRTKLINEICFLWENILKLVTDSSEEIRRGAGPVDSKLKEVVNECLSKNLMIDMKGLVSLLCEKMDTCNPMVRNLLLSWLELLCSIPNVNLLNRVPMFLPPLITYMAEKREEVKIKAKKQLDELLSEFEALGETREAQMDEEILRTLVNYYKRNEFREAVLCRSVTLSWTQNFLAFLAKDITRAPSGSLDMWRNIYPKLADYALTLINDADSGIQHLASVLNSLLHELVGYVLNDEESLTTLIKTITPHLGSSSINTMSMTMDWLILLMKKQPQSLAKASEDILTTMVKMLPELENTQLKKLLIILGQMSKSYEGFFEKVLTKIVMECEKTRGILGKIKLILMTFSENYSKVQLFTVLAQVIANKALENPAFYSELAEILGDIITYEAELYDIRAKLADLASEEGKALFTVLYPAMCYSPSCAILLCYLSQKYELAWLIIHKLAQMKMNKETFVRLRSLAQKIELPAFMYIRLQMLNPENNFYLVKSLQALLMILPQEQAYFSLYNRLKCLNVPLISSEKPTALPKSEEKENQDIAECLKIFDRTADVLNKLP